MKYMTHETPLTLEQRQALNEKVLYLIDSDTAETSGITREDIYNAYTGDGGLHGLKNGDFENYHDYSTAKKEIENGQFFTPANICRLVVESLRLGKSDLVADKTTPRLIQFYILKNAVNPPFLGGFFISSTVAA